MRRTILVVALAWISLSVLNFGAMNADFRWKELNRWPDLHNHQRDDIGMIVLVSVPLAPIEFFTTLILTNFLQHGWTLRSW